MPDMRVSHTLYPRGRTRTQRDDERVTVAGHVDCRVRKEIKIHTNARFYQGLLISHLMGVSHEIRRCGAVFRTSTQNHPLDC